MATAASSETAPSVAPDSEHILFALKTLIPEGQVTELRALNVPERNGFKPTHSGYFDERGKLASEAARLSKIGAEGVYFIPNMVKPDLLARADNRTKIAKQGESTSESGILQRRYLLIDCDPVRESGISSTDEEHMAAIERAQGIAQALAADGWPEPVFADSGNGGHVLYRIDLPAKDGGLVKRCLEALAFRFSDERVVVDQKCSDANRIWKLYGTVARKGDSIPRRPHRVARLLSVPTAQEVVSRELLEELAASLPQPERPSQRVSSSYDGPAFDLEEWIAKHHLEVGERTDWEGKGHKWVFRVCPWNSEHTDRSAYILRFADGAIAAGCHHNGCTGKTWADLRELYEKKDTSRTAPKDKHKAVVTPFPTERKQSEDAGDAPAQVMPERDKPVIIGKNRQLDEMTRDALNVLYAANKTAPFIFWRNRTLARVRRDEHGLPIIEEFDEKIMCCVLAEVADFMYWRKTNKTDENDEPVYELAPMSPPSDLIKNILAQPHWNFPALDGLIEAPALRPDGSIITEPGYDAATRLVYAPDASLALGCIPHHPTSADVARALDIVNDTIGEFPYDGDASRAHAIALLLTAVVRPAIKGLIPLAVLTAPAAGTGKGLLAGLVPVIATGRDAAVATAAEKEEEWGKVITTALLAGSAFILIDDVRGVLSSAKLQAALTATVWQDRALGTNKLVTLPQRAVWMATGNNLQLGGDMPRRVYRIRLDAKMARPERREGFKHPVLMDYVKEHRGELLAALLTIARAWYAAGSPQYKVTPMGSFEAWSKTIGSMLTHAGIQGFLGNLDEMYAETDSERPQWLAFLNAWHETFGDERLTANAVASQIHSAITGTGDRSALAEALPEKLAPLASNLGALTKRLSYELRAQVEVRYELDDGSQVFVAKPTLNRVSTALWCVIHTNTPHNDPSTGRSSTTAEHKVLVINPAQNDHQHPSSQNNSGVAADVLVIAGDTLYSTCEKVSDAIEYVHADVFTGRSSESYQQSPAPTQRALEYSGVTAAGDQNGAQGSPAPNRACYVCRERQWIWNGSQWICGNDHRAESEK